MCSSAKYQHYVLGNTHRAHGNPTVDHFWSLLVVLAGQVRQVPVLRAGQHAPRAGEPHALLRHGGAVSAGAEPAGLHHDVRRRRLRRR
eukprot:1010953-Prorocentrum_minimum.AAC.1